MTCIVRIARRAAILPICLLMLSTCQETRRAEVTVPQRDIQTVQEAHVAELMAIPGVTGVALGKLEDGTPCIQVLVEEETEELKKRIPTTLEGHPVRIVESGLIKPLDGG
ncbi:MAG TPA: hypothetical protein VNN55_12660 [bacterium]|nr:hypothetical protein [bacterium]